MKSLERWIAIAGLLLLGIYPALAPAQTGKLARNKAFSLDHVPGAVLSLGRDASLVDEYPVFLLRIEYPGALTAAALATLVAHVRASDGAVGDLTDLQIRQRLVDGINKSSYFAARLYRAFLQHGGFPPETLIVEPVSLDRADDSGMLRVVRERDRVPAILTLRFLVRRSIPYDVSRPSDDGGFISVYRNTFGNYVAPLTTLLTEPAAWPGSGGVVLMWGWGPADRGITPLSCDPTWCEAAVDDFDNEIAGESFTPGNRRIAWLIGRTELEGVGRSLQPWLLTSRKAPVFSCDDTPASIGESCLYERAIIAIVRQALSQADPYLATRLQWRRYMERIDPELAARWPGGTFGEQERARLRMIKTAMRAERRFTARVAEKMAGLALTESRGIQLREQRAAEREYARSLARTSRGFIRDLAALGDLLVGASALVDAAHAGDTVQALGAAAAATRTLDARDAAQASALRQNDEGFAASTLPSYSALYGEQHRIAIANKEYIADSLAALRALFGDLHREANWPALQRPPERCAVLRRESEVWGWNGDCTADGRERRGAGFALYYVEPGPAYFANAELGDQEMVNYTMIQRDGRVLNVDSPTRAIQLMDKVYVNTAFVNIFRVSIDDSADHGWIGERSLGARSAAPRYHVRKGDTLRDATREESKLIEEHWQRWSAQRRNLIRHEP